MSDAHKAADDTFSNATVRFRDGGSAPLYLRPQHLMRAAVDTGTLARDDAVSRGRVYPIRSCGDSSNVVAELSDLQA